jgi:hypothetical protein
LNGCIYFLSTRCLGGTGESKAFSSTRLATFLTKTPTGYSFVADNAYTLSAIILLIFLGNGKRYPAKAVFNFYLSQGRIKIEQASGIELKLSIIASVVECCVRLHIFCKTIR